MNEIERDRIERDRTKRKFYSRLMVCTARAELRVDSPASRRILQSAPVVRWRCRCVGLKKRDLANAVRSLPSEHDVAQESRICMVMHVDPAFSIVSHDE